MALLEITYLKEYVWCMTLQWRHNGGDSVSNYQPHDCLLNGLFRRRSQKTWTLRVTGLCAGNSPGIGEFPAQMASNAENVFIWWRHHDTCVCVCYMRTGIIASSSIYMCIPGCAHTIYLCTSTHPFHVHLYLHVWQLFALQNQYLFIRL